MSDSTVHACNLVHCTSFQATEAATATAPPPAAPAAQVQLGSITTLVIELMRLDTMRCDAMLTAYDTYVMLARIDIMSRCDAMLTAYDAYVMLARNGVMLRCDAGSRQVG